MSEKKNTTRPGLSGLGSYLPEGSLELIAPMLENCSVIIRIKAPRKSKFGDFRPLQGEKYAHQITLNRDLNPYAFLVTLVHEIAHLHAYIKYKNKIKPHGEEWQAIYAALLRPVIASGILPADLAQVLNRHTQGVTASSCTDIYLFKALREYDDRPDSNGVVLEHLAAGEHFKWRNGLVYRKVEKLRKRYRCIEVNSQRVWFFHPLAEVERLDI